MSISAELFRELEKLSEQNTRDKILRANMTSYSSELEGLFIKLADFQRRETVEIFGKWAHAIGEDRMRDIKNKIANIIHSFATDSSISPADFEIVLNPLYGDIVKIVTPISRMISGTEFLRILGKIKESVGDGEWFAWRESVARLGHLLDTINDNDTKICNYEFNDLFFSMARAVLDAPETVVESLEEFKKIQNILETKIPLFEIKVSGKNIILDIDSKMIDLKCEIEKIEKIFADNKSLMNAAISNTHSEKIRVGYDQLRDKQKTINLCWLVSAGVFFVAALGYIGYLLWNHQSLSDLPYHISTWQFLLFAAPKIALFSLLVTASLWCGRMYKIGKNIEETYSRIVTGINATKELTYGDTEQMNKHLPKLIESFFTLPDSGYITGKDAPSFISQIAGLFQNKS